MSDKAPHSFEQILLIAYDYYDELINLSVDIVKYMLTNIIFSSFTWPAFVA